MYIVHSQSFLTFLPKNLIAFFELYVAVSILPSLNLHYSLYCKFQSLNS